MVLVLDGMLGAVSPLLIEIEFLFPVVSRDWALSSFLMGSSLHVAAFCATAFHHRPVDEEWVGPEDLLKVPAYQTITIPVPRLPLIPIMDITRVPYPGSTRKFILALDIGTTFSGAAYAFLDPGQVPEIRSVTKQALPLVPDPVTSRDE